MIVKQEIDLIDTVADTKDQTLWQTLFMASQEEIEKIEQVLNKHFKTIPDSEAVCEYLENNYQTIFKDLGIKY